MDEEDGFALASGNADVGFARLAGAIDDTAHNGHLDGLFVALQPLFDLIGNLGAGVLGAAAGRAGDDLGACHREAHRTQDVVAGLDFLFRLRSQRNTDGIADAFQQHSADAHAGLQQTHLVGTGLGDAHMERVVGDGTQLAVSFHHAGHVGVFDGDDDVVEIEFFQQTDMVERTLDHRFRHRRTVLGQNVLFKAAAVDADPNGDVLLLAGLHNGFHPVVVADVARVDADLVHTHLGAGQSRLVIKVDIRHDGDVHSVLDGLDALGIGGTGAGDAEDLAARCLAPLGLCYVALDVLHRNVQHGLHRDGVIAADGHIANFHFSFELPHCRCPFLHFIPFHR